MEEHQAPVHEGPAIVASNKKHSWSKKERLALYVAGVFALVGIGFGGFTFYNQVILNAAGEDSLGSDVVVDLPAANESPYFKVLWVSQQDVGILPTGDAAAPNSPANEFAVGWKLEQSTNPVDENAWVTVVQPDDSYNDSTTNCGSTSSDTNRVMLPIIASGLRHIGQTGTNCTSLDKSLGYANPALMQPDTDYYYRAAKRIVLTDANGTTSNNWEPQGNIVRVKTKTYPELQLNQDKNQVVLSWTGASGYGSQNGFYEFSIARTTNPADFATTVTDWRDNSNGQYESMPRVTYAIDVNRPENTDFTAGQKTITQKANLTYYYALVIQDRHEGTIYRIVSKVFPVTTGTTVSNVPIVNLSISPVSVPANKLDTIKLAASLRDTCNGYGCDLDIDNTIVFKDVAGYTLYSGMSASTTGYEKDKSIIASDDNRSITMSAIASSLSPYSWIPADIAPGSYTLTSVFTVNRNASQTITTPVQLTKVTPNLSANFKASTVKYKTDIVINIKNAYPENYSVLPTGKIIIKNLKTKKTIKEVTLADYQTSKKITLKGVKKGKYNLAVIFQADSKKGIFENQTINLPQLTVK